MTSCYGSGSATAGASGILQSPEVLKTDLVAPLPELGVIEVSGPDALPFLSAQLTNDLRVLPEAGSQIGAWCTAQGRVLMVARICKRDAAFLLILPLETLTATLGRLQRYVLRAQVELRDGAGRIAFLGLSGPNAPSRAATRIGAAPERVDAVVHGGPLTALRLPGSVPRCLILGPPDEIAKLREVLWAGSTEVGAETWTLFDILAGIPTVVPATAEHFVPQMINLDALGGLSFSKGCYPGQEVIARLKYRGTLKRRMYLARATAPAVPEPGERLYRGGSESASAVGEVVAAAAYPGGGLALLAVVEIEAARGGAVHLEGAERPVLRFEALPYAVAAS